MEFRTAIVNTVKYLISHFLKNGFLMDLTYMDHDMRADPMFVKKLVRDAEHTGRFSDHELEDLAVQLQAVKTLQVLYLQRTPYLQVRHLHITSS